MQHSFWHQIPIVRLLFPFAIGIGVSMFYPIGLVLSVSICAALLLISIVSYVTFHRYGRRWLFGLFTVTAMLFGGFALHAWQNELRNETHYKNFPQSKYIEVCVIEQPIVKPSSVKMRCKALNVADSNGTEYAVQGSLIVYLQHTPKAKVLKYGDVILLPYKLVQPVSPPQNPDEFDYKRYLAFNNIYYQAYATQKDWMQLPFNVGNELQKWIYRVQQYFKSVLSRCIVSHNETGVAQALLYGYDDDIDAETVQAYANTGTLHVLAVSGMHVGIIFMIMGLLLKPLDKYKKLSIVKQVIILCVLWVYSLLCGFSPSILRATVMFSFIIFSSILNVRSNVYNTLAASAFVLLVADTNMLANVGFQLSYLAVVGIVFFQPLIYKWYTPSGWLMDEVWKITAVSIAAQLVTFPIGVLYFHQFPNCFLFSNLIIIPLTTLILYMSMMLLVVAKLSWVSWLLGQLLFYAISFTNAIVKVVESIPYAYVNGIHISIIQSICLYGMIGCITAFFLLRQVQYLKITLGFTLLFCCFQSVHQFQNNQQSRILVYNIHKHTAIHFINGNDAYLLADTSLVDDKNKMKFHLQQHIWKSGITNHQINDVDANWKQIETPNFTCIVSGSTPLMLPKICDVLIVRHPFNQLHQLTDIHPKQVIITSALTTYQATKIKHFYQAKNIPISYVGETGAIEVSLPN